MSLLKRLASARQLLARAANRAESIVNPAIVAPHPTRDALDALPASLVAALGAKETNTTGHLVTRPRRMMIASSAETTLKLPPGAVALSTDAKGLVQWHLPKPGGSVRVSVERVVAQGRKLVVTALPGPQDLGLAALHAFERSLGKPAMKRLPPQSSFPELAAAPRIDQGPQPERARTLAGTLELLLHKEPRTDIPEGRPVLVLVHGIFDSVFGFAFLPLLLWGDLLERLQRHYPGGVFGFDHETLAVDPLQNAADLLDRLPSNTPIDILCHSRGGLATRALLQHPRLQERLRTKTIRKVIFMGAANHGSPLAEPEHLADMLNIFTHLFQHLAPEGAAADHLQLLVRAVAVLVRPATELPGVAALQPGSRLIGELSPVTARPGEEYTFIGANFGEATEPWLRELEGFSDRGFRALLNDLVVPLKGTTEIGAAPPPNGPPLILDHATKTQGGVYHLNYLDSPRVRQHIVQFLGVP